MCLVLIEITSAMLWHKIKQNRMLWRC